MALAPCCCSLICFDRQRDFSVVILDREKDATLFRGQ